MAFWRSKDSAADTKKRASAASTDSAAAHVEPADIVRVRARRRLIGAAALLLLVVIVVPMVLDPEPKPASDNIAIDIPSEKTRFTPRLTLPPVPGPENVPLAPPPEFARAPEKFEELPAKADGKKGEEQRARALLDGKSNAKPAVGEKGARFAVQAAAPASETAARDLAERLKKSGLAPYTEKVETKQGARYRVRLGPYASRDEADGVRTRLKAQGISANLVTL
ncbi:MAG TPA: SPOR domain-containing protein [Burkholderiaceae bacterium]|nr:SPOR domain-containing protein [Burkholderiaceae bacterium]